jgi:hypothetical protein
MAKEPIAVWCVGRIDGKKVDVLMDNEKKPMV